MEMDFCVVFCANGIVAKFSKKFGVGFSRNSDYHSQAYSMYYNGGNSDHICCDGHWPHSYTCVFSGKAS